MIKLMCLASALSVTVAITYASDIPMGCNDRESYFDAMEYNESVKPLGVFGPETGMDMSGELFMDKGITYEAIYFESQICVSVAEPSTVYNVNVKG